MAAARPHPWHQQFLAPDGVSRHFFVKAWVGQLFADNGFAHIIDDAFCHRIVRQLTFGVELLGDGIVNAGVYNQLHQRVAVHRAHVARRISLNIGVDQVAHISFKGLDIQLFTRVAFNCVAHLAVERHFVVQSLDLVP